MSNHGSNEEIANRSSSEHVAGEIPEFQTLTQEAVKEKMRGFIAPLTRQLEELSRLVQRMNTARHPNSYPRTELSTTSGTAMPQSDSDQQVVLVKCSGQTFSSIRYLISYCDHSHQCCHFYFRNWNLSLIQFGNKLFYFLRKGAMFTITSEQLNYKKLFISMRLPNYPNKMFSRVEN